MEMIKVYFVVNAMWRQCCYNVKEFMSCVILAKRGSDTTLSHPCLILLSENDTDKLL